MKMTKVLELMKIERECVTRQDTVKCQRNCHPEHGCYGCDLVQNGDEIIEAYDEVIKHYQSMIDSIEEFVRYVKEGDHQMVKPHETAMKHPEVEI